MALSRMKNVRIPKITAEDQEENGGKKKKKRKMKLRDKYMMLTNTKFRDSLCIIPVKLGKMIETLGLKDENGNPLTDKGIRIISFYKKYFQAIFPLKFYNKKIIIVFYPTIHRQNTIILIEKNPILKIFWKSSKKYGVKTYLFTNMGTNIARMTFGYWLMAQ